tara:strand:+ start:5491 stop:6561 length:1071 start_codon:yes stop_codon:yes gene_type:complete
MKREKPNIFIIGSPWHAVIAEAMSRENDIYIIEYATDSNLDAIKLAITEHSKIFLSIKGALFYFSTASKKLFLNSSRIKNEARSIKAKVMGLEANNLYLFNINSQFSLYCSNLISNNKTVKIEDGVCDYLTFNLVPENGFSRFVKKFISNVFGMKNIHFPKKIDVHESYFFYPERAPDNHIGKKSLFGYVDLINAKLAELDTPHLGKTNNDVLIIGQTMYEDRYCSLEDEMEFYLLISQKMLKTGNKKIYFKPHPRTSLKKQLLLESFEKKKCFTLLKTELLVEGILSKHDFSYIFGMWSNPIIYSRPLFNINSFTMIPHLLEIKNNLFLSKINDEMVRIFSEFYIDYRTLDEYRD